MSNPKLPKGPISADELARLKEEMLRNDPEYRAKVEAAEADRQERARVLPMRSSRSWLPFEPPAFRSIQCGIW